MVRGAEVDYLVRRGCYDWLAVALLCSAAELRARRGFTP